MVKSSYRQLDSIRSLGPTAIFFLIFVGVHLPLAQAYTFATCYCQYGNLSVLQQWLLLVLPFVQSILSNLHLHEISLILLRGPFLPTHDYQISMHFCCFLFPTIELIQIYLIAMRDLGFSSEEFEKLPY